MTPEHIVWDLDDDPDGNVQHILDHGISADEVEEVLLDRTSVTTVSRSTGNPITFGYTSTGRCIAVVWEPVMGDRTMMRPITAYDAPESRRR